METRPDLPGLESVQASMRGILVVVGAQFAFLLAIVVAAVWGFLKFHPHMGDDFTWAALVLGVIVVLSLVTAIRLLAAEYSWSTGQDGLTARSIFRSKFIPWLEVQEADIRGMEGLGRGWVLKSTKAKVHIEEDHAVLLASIWQHLRRLRKADKLEPPYAALTLWDHIPDELPRELSWTGRFPTMILVNSVAAILLIPLFIRWFAADLNPLSLAFVAVMVLTCLFVVISNYRLFYRSAGKVEIDKEAIAARVPRRTIRVPWSEVVQAKWTTDINNQSTIRIRGTESSEVLIPFNPRNEDSSKLILAIIRRLRTAGVPQALVIPNVLRSMRLDQPPKLDSFERKLTKFERGVFYGLLVITAFPAIMIARQERPDLLVLVAIVIAAVTLITHLAVRSYSVKADTHGIAKRCLTWRKFIPWTNIADYKVIQPRVQSSPPAYHFKDSRGKTLITIGSERKTDPLLQFIVSRLTQFLPASRIDESWKARPSDGAEF